MLCDYIRQCVGYSSWSGIDNTPRDQGKTIHNTYYTYYVLLIRIIHHTQTLRIIRFHFLTSPERRREPSQQPGRHCASVGTVHPHHTASTHYQTFIMASSPMLKLPCYLRGSKHELLLSTKGPVRSRKHSYSAILIDRPPRPEPACGAQAAASCPRASISQHLSKSRIQPASPF